MSNKESDKILNQIKNTFNISDINCFENDFTISAYQDPAKITKAITMAKQGLKTSPGSVFFLEIIRVFTCFAKQS